jgi:hypothetical protein
MARVVVGLFDTFAQAQQAVDDLVASGLSRNQVSLIANNARGEYQVDRAVGDSNAAEGAGTGAVSGGLLGGTLGLLVGLGALAIPGIGPVIAAGTLTAAAGTAAAGAGIGAATGGLIGALAGAGVSESDAHIYAEGVRRGGALVSVESEGEEADAARMVLERNGAVDTSVRGEELRRTGWERFDPAAGEWRDDRPGTPIIAPTGAVVGGPIGGGAGTGTVGVLPGTLLAPDEPTGGRTVDEIENDDTASIERERRRQDPAP